MAAQQSTVQPDVGDEEGAFKAQQRPLPMARPRKAKPVPDRFVAAGRAMQARHLGRRPGIVVEIKPGKSAILTLAKRRNRHSPPGRQLLPVERLRGKEREAVIQWHQVLRSDMAPSTDRTR